MRTEVPSVLAVLISRNGAPWLRRALSSLARQTHPRFGVLAVDNASTDGSGDLLAAVLGPRRVIRLAENRGLPGAVQRALEVPAAREADFVLVLHDDVALAPEAVSRMVEEAGRVRDAGIVGPKVVDWEEPRILREVGFGTDRFGHPHSPLEDGEIDQGQYDGAREVLFISSAAMLVVRGAWDRAGLPDERLGPAHADLDFCWRVRLAGYRVLVTPRAVALHRRAGHRGERAEAPPPREGYQRERAGLAGVLVNYRLITLLWILPLYAIQGLGRLVGHLVGRRFNRAGQILAAWGWNLRHLPGTVRRRRRSQAARRVSDREIARFMSPGATRFQRWAGRTSGLLVGRRAAKVEEGEELEAPAFRDRVTSVVRAHPVAVGWTVALAFTLFAFRGVLFAGAIEGGVYPVFPDGPAAFFRAFAADWRITGFGGPELASPALVPLGIGSFLALGNPALLGRLVVAFGPAAAGTSCYAAIRRLGPGRGASVVGAACYGAAAPVLWAASEGRIGVIVFLGALPWISSRIVTAFGREGPSRSIPWIVGTGMGIALALSFYPSSWIGVAAVALPLVALPPRGGSRLRGIPLAVGAAAAGAILIFPFVVTLAEAGPDAVAPGALARARFADFLRLAPGPAPGSGIAAAFLPVAGLLAFAVTPSDGRRAAWRALITGAAAVPLAWLAAAAQAPPPLDDPVAYLAAAAYSLAVLVGLGIAGLRFGVRRTAFGTPQVVAVALTVVLVLGLSGQVLRVLPGDWGVGRDRIAPAWPVVGAADPGSRFRVLWLGPADGLPFPPPGGDPDGTLDMGGTTVAYGITERTGRSVLSIGVPTNPRSLERLEVVLASVVGDRVRHGGALLAPLGIRYVVAGEGRLPHEAARLLGQQVDLDLIQRAGGLSIYRNARAFPPAAVIPGEAAVDAAATSSLLAPLGLEATTAAPLTGAPEPLQGSATEGGPSLVLVADGFDPRWTARSAGAETSAFPAFGWAVGVEVQPGPVTVAFDGGSRRTLELVSMGVLWAAALWIVRRREDHRPSPETSVSVGVAAEPTGSSGPP